jgi:hypothetical protein
MEVMNVPHARSRISLAPSPVKRGGRVREIPPVSGEGIFDVVKSVGKAVAPVALDLASSYAKKKVMGEGVLDVVKSIAPIAIDLVRSYKKVGGAHKRLRGGSFMPSGGNIMTGRGRGQKINPKHPQQGRRNTAESIWGDLIHANLKPTQVYTPEDKERDISRIMDLLIDSSEAEVRNVIQTLAGKFGGSIYPAGMYGKGIDNPIQLGSPYQYSSSPAMSPFIPDRSIQSYNPIKSKHGSGVIGSTIGQVLGSMLPI